MSNFDEILNRNIENMKNYQSYVKNTKYVKIGSEPIDIFEVNKETPEMPKNVSKTVSTNLILLDEEDD